MKLPAAARATTATRHRGVTVRSEGAELITATRAYTTVLPT